MDLQDQSILVVDDDEINLMVAKKLLEKKLSCRVFIAGNGADGLDILWQQPVNLVLLDIEMPQMDGFETLRNIRSDEKTKDIPVIMLTAASDEEALAKLAKERVTGYVKKPFLPMDLIEAVENALMK